MDKTLVKGLAVLEALAKYPDGASVSELAAELDLYKSNIHRVLQTLVFCRYVNQFENGKYGLTFRLWELGTSVIEHFDVARIARTFMRELAQEAKETVYLAVLEGEHCLYMDKIDSPNSVRAFMAVGSRAPDYCVATGKVILAFSSEARIESAVSRLKAHTPYTITDPDKYRLHLAEIREKGYATNVGEFEIPVRGVAAPILSGLGQPLAAIGITAPANRMPDSSFKRFGLMTVKAARQIEHAMGGGVQHDLRARVTA